MNTRTDEPLLNLADDALKAALATLPPRERKAFEMKAAGHSCADIAARFKVSRATAYRLWSKAQQKLKARLKAGARAGK